MKITRAVYALLVFAIAPACKTPLGYEAAAEQELGSGAVCIMSVHGGPISCVRDGKLYVCAVHGDRAACASVDDATKARLDAATGASE